MSSNLVPFTYPSVTNLLCSWFASVSGELDGISADAISTDLPYEYAQHLPFIRVTRVTGVRSKGFDDCSIRFEVFASSYDDAEALANTLDVLIEYGAHGHITADASIVAARCVAGATHTAWDDPDTTRFMSTWDMTIAALQ